MFETTRKAHWEGVYSSKAETAVSWRQKEARLSLDLIRAFAPSEGGRIIDVGGGALYRISSIPIPFSGPSGGLLGRATSPKVSDSGDSVLVLVDGLLHLGFEGVTVLDIAEPA